VNPVIWGITAAAVAATVWHALSEHHAHRRLLRRFRPGTVVPETRHDTWWHSLPKSHRVAVQAALTAAGLAAGIAYETVPAVVMAVLGGLVAAATVLLIIRTTGTAVRASGPGDRPLPARESLRPPAGRLGGPAASGRRGGFLSPPGYPGDLPCPSKGAAIQSHNDEDQSMLQSGTPGVRQDRYGDAELQ
jgi:hypothetical protein